VSAAREVEDEGGCDDAPATALGPVTEANLGALLPTVVSMVVVILAQSAATSRAYAMRSGPLAYMPNAVLASVVFLIGLRLVDYRGMADVARLRRGEFMVALATAAVVVAAGVEQGFIPAVALSIVSHGRLRGRVRGPERPGLRRVPGRDPERAPGRRVGYLTGG
jgi:MFS superfamily sulfate permease-like transporter